MKFVFKRKYTLAFVLSLVLIGLCVAFYYIGPKFITQTEDFFNKILILSILDSVLIILFITGLYRVNYFLYHDHVEIKRSLRSPIILNYDQIKEVIEIKNDTIFLGCGVRPSFKIKYQQNGRIKTYRVRVANHNLFKTVLENEKKIRMK